MDITAKYDKNIFNNYFFEVVCGGGVNKPLISFLLHVSCRSSEADSQFAVYQ